MSSVRPLRILYCICLAFNILLAVLGERDTFVNLCAPDSQLAFSLEIASIAATLAALPVAAKLKRAKRVVLVHLCCAVVVVCYYLTLSSSSASTSSMLCLAIVACAMLYCWPNGRRPQSGLGENASDRDEAFHATQFPQDPDSQTETTRKQ